jgi:homogentisate phytyltransferase/homogentisate geranylgeranyltransferase
MEGDQEYQIKTLTLSLGPKKVFLTGNALILMAYLLIIISAAVVNLGLSASVLVVSHLIFTGLLLGAGRQVDLFDREQVFKYYQFIWGLFFLEYIAFAVGGWIATYG